MATFTFTTTAAEIDVLSGVGTLATLYTDAVADTAGCMTNPSADVYEVAGNRKLEFSSGVEVTMEAGDTLQWDLSASGTKFQIDSGSKFIVEEGCTINCDTSNGHYGRWYIYGHTSFQGTQADPIIITRYYEQRIYSTEGNDPHDWDWVEFQDPSTYSSSNTAIYFYADRQVALAHSFVNITLNNRTNTGYIASFYPGDWTDIEFDQWTATDTRYGFSSYGANFKFTNSTFTQITYYSLIRGNGASNPYVTASNATSPDSQYQPKVTFDTCTFTDCYNASSTEYGFYISYSANIKFKDCTFSGVEDQLARGVYSVNNSKMLYEGTTTFTNVGTDRLWGGNGTHLHTYSLALTVNDSGGSPIENAHVIVRQKEGHEVWHFETNASGQIKDLFGDNPVFVYQEETSTGVYDIWSDGNGNLVHEITISHPSYQVDTREVAFSENRTITAALTANATGVTTIYDSTIYDSTIY